MYCETARFRHRNTQWCLQSTDGPKSGSHRASSPSGFITLAGTRPKTPSSWLAGNVVKFGQNPKLGCIQFATRDCLLVRGRVAISGLGHRLH
ncbi:hypothetical protein GGR50DRAFT_647618 [Xylaria sp. CBS 124048]|nr:hypothetical protein GGR50DRAFT_647618 [Xylaria sp. CBS 124048]